MITNIESLFLEFDKREKEILDDLFTLLKFQTISAQQESRKDMKLCAEWLVKYLTKSKFKTELWETTGWPSIFAQWDGAGPEKPTILFYGHYDVQPVDPIELWTTPPFEPEIRDGKIFARGAQDNKGQIWFTISALAYLLERDGKLPVNVKLLIDGEEEIASAGLTKLLPSKSAELKADHLAIIDFGIGEASKPALTLGMRGFIAIRVELIGSATDLHSGLHGGIAYNPNHALVELLAKMRDASGKITIPGFYDDIAELSPEELKNINLIFDFKSYGEIFGAAPTGGEKNLSPNESRWLRPTVEINGIGGGYVGEGIKTVIPAKAVAQLSCRLVPNQNPEKIANLLIEFIKSNLPEGITLKATINPGAGDAVRANLNSPIVQAAVRSYSEVLGIPVKFILEGWSVPIVAQLARISGGDFALLGLALPGDFVHAPNEHFGVDRIKQGFVSTIRLVENL